MLLGCWLRCAHVDRKSHWEDEFWTVRRISYATLADVVQNLEHAPFPPLHYVAVWGWTQFWGDRDVGTIRWVSVLAGLAAIPVTWCWWSKSLPRGAAGWATALVALNSYHIWYSLDAKMYAEVWLWATLSSAAYVWGVYGSARRRDYACLAFADACLLLTSFVGVVVLGVQVAHGGWVFLRRADRRQTLLRCLAATLCGLMPVTLWVHVAYASLMERRGIGWIPPLRPPQLGLDLVRMQGLWLTGVFLGDFRPREAWGRWLVIAVPVALVVAAALLAALLVQWIRAPRRALADDGVAPLPDASRTPHAHEVVGYLFCWWLLPVAATAAFSWLVYSVWGVPRYLTAAAPALPLLLGVAVATCRWRRLATAAGCLLLAVNLAAQGFDQQRVTRTPWRLVVAAINAEVAAHPEEFADPTQPVVVAFAGLDRLYFDHQSLQLALEQLLRRAPWERLSLADLATRGADGPFFIVIQSRVDSSPHSVRAIQKDFPGLQCGKLYSVKTYEEFYSRLPTPFASYVTEVWIARPSPGPTTDAALPRTATHDSTASP